MTDTAAERARELLTQIMAHASFVSPDGREFRPTEPVEVGPITTELVAAALRAAEAGAIERTLTAAAEWHDARYVELRDNPDGRFGLVSGISGARMHEHRESAEHFRALASAMAMQREGGT